MTSSYTFSSPIQLQIKEKAFSLSGDSFKIRRLDDNTEIFQVKGHAFSFKEAKTLCDGAGAPIYRLTENIVSLRDRMNIINAQTGQTVFTLRKKGFIPHVGTGTVKVWDGNKVNGSPALVIKGSIFKRSFSIEDATTGRTIGTVHKKLFTLNNFLFDKDTYVLTVHPGADVALLTILVVALDEHYHD